MQVIVYYLLLNGLLFIKLAGKHNHTCLHFHRHLHLHSSISNLQHLDLYFHMRNFHMMLLQLPSLIWSCSLLSFAQVQKLLLNNIVVVDLSLDPMMKPSPCIDFLVKINRSDLRILEMLCYSRQQHIVLMTELLLVLKLRLVFSFSIMKLSIEIPA